MALRPGSVRWRAHDGPAFQGRNAVSARHYLSIVPGVHTRECPGNRDRGVARQRPSENKKGLVLGEAPVRIRETDAGVPGPLVVRKGDVKARTGQGY